MEAIKQATDSMITRIRTEFNRFNQITKAGAEMDDAIIDGSLWLTFRKGTTNQSLHIPLPVINEKGLKLLQNNDVTRVVCDYWIEVEQKRLTYLDVVERLVIEDVNSVMPHLESGTSLMHKIVRGFNQDCMPYMASRLQNLINEVVNTMPLHETDMNTWAMNHRLIIIDPVFSQINDPNHRLDYQVAKNEKYYERFGWTSIGLSDNVLADSNTILTTDLRKLTPFGLHHNPQRNLYSTLCMKGDELPKVRTQSMQELIDRGITRKGWNLITAVLDTPLNFEDQILVDRKMLEYHTTTEKKYVVYNDQPGCLFVKEGERVHTGQRLGVSKDGASVLMRMKAEKAWVTKIKRDSVAVGGDQVQIYVITVKGKRYIKDGTKFSNLHGNKGIIKVIDDLGWAIDPRTGEEVKIEVMISAKSVNKRANFGQLLEALLNNLRPDDDSIILGDGDTIDVPRLKRNLVSEGLPEDGVWMINTYCGEFEAVVGKMFWGVTKDPEDQLWEGDRTAVTNNQELRTSGLKFSHVEMKAITTRFGHKSAVYKEILSHAQGGQNLKDEIRTLRSANGHVDSSYPVINVSNVKTVDTSNGIFHTPDQITGTVVDEEYFTDGFLLQLPVKVQIIAEKKDPDVYRIGIPQPVTDPEKIAYSYDTIFIPNSLLRRCWRHPSGKWGLSIIGANVNYVVQSAQKYLEMPTAERYSDLAKAVGNYFRRVSQIMGSKSGDLSVYGMSVRYPHSSRATAAGADHLPENTIEIHETMAKSLEVKTGDVVLAERFPCLGFVSVRPQYVRVTDDPLCRYVIRVSGNSLVSQNLDFDGDTLFLASFKTPKAIEELHREMRTPNPVCDREIKRINARKIPEIRELNLDDYQLRTFPKPTVKEHAEIVRKATGVKSHTGPVIALAYNLMRIVEAHVPYDDVEQHVALEILLDFLGNTVFSQKHGIKSLQEEATDAICVADVDRMVELGFERKPSETLCNLIRKEAASIGTRDLKSYHEFIKARGGSKIINKIVRLKHRVYFATRAKLGPIRLLEHLVERPNDLPSEILIEIMQSSKEKVSEMLCRLKIEKAKKRFRVFSKDIEDARDALVELVEDICGESGESQPNIVNLIEAGITETRRGVSPESEDVNIFDKIQRFRRRVKKFIIPEPNFCLAPV